MPMLDMQLAGDDGGLVAGAIVDDLQQVRARHAVDGAHAPVIEHQQVGLRQLERPFAEGLRCTSNSGHSCFKLPVVVY